MSLKAAVTVVTEASFSEMDGSTSTSNDSPGKSAAACCWLAGG